MGKSQLSIRSEHARDIADRLAKRHRRSVTRVVEMALEALESQETETEETGREFVERLLRIDPGDSIDIDLEALIREGREPHHGVDLK